ncbi:putative zinc-binding metallopeptidase [Mycobacterium sp.]|uniref:putative zinc-binding metallopeptidase n=1 Tax=Mycobacterium sp. TaxID=1785 RepID=UPI00333E9612
MRALWITTTSSAHRRAGEAYISEYATMHPWEDFAEVLPTICTSPTPSRPAARPAWCCTPTDCGSPHPAMSSPSTPTRMHRSSRCCSTGHVCRCSSTASTLQW